MKHLISSPALLEYRVYRGDQLCLNGSIKMTSTMTPYDLRRIIFDENRDFASLYDMGAFCQMTWVIDQSNDLSNDQSYSQLSECQANDSEQSIALSTETNQSNNQSNSQTIDYMMMDLPCVKHRPENSVFVIRSHPEIDRKISFIKQSNKQSNSQTRSERQAQRINQSNSQSIAQTDSQLHDHPIDQTNQSINQSINQTNNQSINRTIIHTTSMSIGPFDNQTINYESIKHNPHISCRASWQLTKCRDTSELKLISLSELLYDD